MKFIDWVQMLFPNVSAILDREGPNTRQPDIRNWCWGGYRFFWQISDKISVRTPDIRPNFHISFDIRPVTKIGPIFCAFFLLRWTNAHIWMHILAVHLTKYHNINQINRSRVSTLIICIWKNVRWIFLYRNIRAFWISKFNFFFKS